MLQIRRLTLVAAGTACLALGALWLARTGRSVVFAQSGNNQLSVYAKQAAYSVALLERNGQTYVGLVELLEPLGTVDAREDGKKFKLKFSAPGSKEVEFQFQSGKDKGKIRGSGTKLPSAFLLENGRGYIPLASVGDVLAPALSASIRLNATGRRLFIGESGKTFSLELRPGSPSKLFVSFDSPVSPFISTEAGQIRFTFRRDAVLPSIEQTSFNDSVITGARFTEHDGVGELAVTGSAPLTANFADGGKTIVISALPPPAPPVAAPQAPIIPTPSAPAAATAAQSRAPSGPRYFVLIDPAHGGTDNGAAITPELAEKDVVLALARKLQRELENRGISASLLRNGDIAIPLDQRAVTANATRPALYVALHAANTGTGVHVFTSLLDGNDAAGRGFIQWQKAQAEYADASSSTAAAVMAELVSKKLPNLLLSTPLRPLNNVAAPAIAIEIAPPGDQVADIAKPAYLAQIAQAIADGVAASRNRVKEGQP